MLAMIDPIDDNHLRAVNRQTTVQESRHRLGRKVFHGKRGQLHQKYRDGQEDQLGALGLIVNAITLWNTRYLDAAVTELTRKAQRMYDSRTFTMAEIAATCGVIPMTIYRHITTEPNRVEPTPSNP
ncbi:hypothetical protein ABMA10_03875 [Plantibacter sp. RU18]